LARETLAHIRKLIKQADPDVVEVEVQRGPDLAFAVHDVVAGTTPGRLFTSGWTNPRYTSGRIRST
jgi:hypothetical protein